MLKDDPRFQAIYQQVLKLWRTMDAGTQEEIAHETDVLTLLLESPRGPNGA
jgi:hypothetical protein